MSVELCQPNAALHIRSIICSVLLPEVFQTASRDCSVQNVLLLVWFFGMQCYLLRLKLCPKNMLNFMEVPKEEGGSSCAPRGLG